MFITQFAFGVYTAYCAQSTLCRKDYALAASVPAAPGSKYK